MSSKQREALLAVYECAKDGVLTIRESAFEKVMEALAEPLRNCDVGTAEEQECRFHDFCGKHASNGCGSCPAVKGAALCVVNWGQMPYEKGGAK